MQSASNNIKKIAMNCSALSEASFYSVRAFGAVDTLLLIRTMVLLPARDARVATIAAGGHFQPSAGHLIYVVMDGLKLAILSSMAEAAIPSQRR